MQCHSQAVDNRKDVMRLSFTKCATSLTPCVTLVIGKDDKTVFPKWVYHSQAVGYSKRCGKTASHKMCDVTHMLLVMRSGYHETIFHKMCNVTHKLLVVGTNVMKLLFTRLQCCLHSVGHRKRCGGLHSQNVQSHLLPVGHRKKKWWNCLSQNVQFLSQPVGHRK
jgi:hypothetical protein